MTTFEIKRHIEFCENFQGINLNEFFINADHNTSNDQIVDAFIRSRSFVYDCLWDSMKKETKEHCHEQTGFLRRAFDFNKVKITDFKKCSKEETVNFLFAFLNKSDWGDDKSTFSNILDKYLEIHERFLSDDFYIISQDWFDKGNWSERGDERLFTPECLIYSYYFLIISIDRNSGSLAITEWVYD